MSQIVTINDLIDNNTFDDTQKYTSGFDYKSENAGVLDLSQLDLEVDIQNIDEYPNQEYALLRKNGLGTSDSSIVLGVNPYTSKAELVREKCRNYLTEDELAVGDKSAVRKGRELEPLIIHKKAQIMGRRVIKPTDMYRHKDYPYIKFNFDGVLDKVYNEDNTYQYIPTEIKLVTVYGQKHYKGNLATYIEGRGWQDIPQNWGDEKSLSIEEKANRYGIPPYYYTQLQQQIFGLNAPYGFLTVMFESSWQVHSYFIWRDQTTINQLIIEDSKVWNLIEQKRPKDFDLGVTIRE